MSKKTIFAASLAASLLAFGAAAQAQGGFDPYGDIDRDGIQNRYDNDRDGDGVENRSDIQPNIWNRSRLVRGHDMDGDGIADRSDRDRDGDGVANARDPAPNNPNIPARHARNTGPNGDMDRDGIVNSRDRDRDGDGIANARDAFPNNPRRA